MDRTATCERRTRETDIHVQLCLDGGATAIDTGVGFFDHMLTALAFHGGLGLTVTARGDLRVDAHHTVEDVGIVLGQAIARTLGDRGGIARCGSAHVPMDEALAFAAVDCSGRPFLHFEAAFAQARMGDYDACLTEEFFRALSVHAGLTLHLRALYGYNAHHVTEALFKAAARALREALRPTEGGIPSTKGTLA